MKPRVNFKGQTLKYLTGSCPEPLEGNVTIYFKGKETTYPRQSVINVLQGLFNDKCITLKNSIHQLAAIITESQRRELPASAIKKYG